MTEQTSDIYLTPNGRPRLVLGDTAHGWGNEGAARALEEAFEDSPAKGALLLGTKYLELAVPPGAVWWREIVRLYLTQLCHAPNLDSDHDVPSLPPPAEREWASLLERTPPMRGGEYLTATVLTQLWGSLDELVRAQVAAHQGGVGGWLADSHPLWRTVGRVTFHLAENKNNPTAPFAFVATYTSRISNQSRQQHLPLGRALQEYAGAQNKQALLKLLTPIQTAAERSPLVKEMFDSGQIFKALAWSPRQAHRFLQEAPVFEASGLLTKLPDWWKSKRPPRPKVSVRIGENGAGGLGVAAMLDFSVEVALDGEKLTEAELKALLKSADGLALVRGKWVEADPAKLAEALAHWEKVERATKKDGLSFYEGMRLIAGLNLAGSTGSESDEPATEADWTGVQPGRWLKDTLTELKNPQRSAQTAIPGLKANLRPYQADGVHWLFLLTRLGLGGCLADDMGLGKTIQVLAMLLQRKAESKQALPPSLLIVPASLLANWRAEILRFAPSLTFRIIHPSEDNYSEDSATMAAKASPQRNASPGDDLVITTYGIALRLDSIRQKAWSLVILDEAQAIKNPNCRQTRAVKEIKASCRIALTGTPVENRAGDLWSIFDFINPGLLGSATSFGQFIRSRESSDRSDFGPLRAVTRPYILRRLKTDRSIISDLPEKTEVRAWCNLTKSQTALYQQSVDELAERLENSEGIQRRGLVLAFIMRFKQICNHPSQWLQDGSFRHTDSGKFSRLGELAEEIAERQEKVLIFTQFREITEPISGFLAPLFGRPGLVLHGGVAVPRRRELVEDFQRDDGPPFFILTVKAGGAGLNLTRAAHVIHFDRWWNPAVENQATDRAFRIGQKQNVLVHKFVCRGTVEERIDQMIEDKKALATDLLEGGAEKMLTEMNNEELLQFVSLDLARATDR